ncbi:DNA polymerase III subunit beta [Aureliella helgolandensis]|uniref:Beta sliding clamp n=1 Tax=Aureliella helgolandensis TaxID=2527968 RepID=A0A518FZM8_9BACT|nr:DNA polymerase III subunit beta [Aureliella helgolandensis]QDV21724.1 DNA polymerase III subunit beta [Aureliella helgolandensis]
MKISCDREKLANAFQLAGSVALARSPKEILQNVKIEASDEHVTLMATDMETGIRIEIDGVEVETAGKALLHVARVGMILRESSDERLSIESDGSATVIKGTHSEFNLPSSNPDEFPTVAGFEEEAYHELPARLFREMVKRTAFATDADSSRFALGGVLLEMSGEDVLAVGTDGRRLARMIGAGKSVGDHATSGNSTIIPTRSLTLMERAIGDKEDVVHIAARNNDVLLRTTRCTIYSRLVEGRYPNWRQVIPSREGSAIIDMTVGPFFNVIRQAAIVADQETRGLDMEFGNGTLVLTAKTADLGQSRVELPIDYDGESIKLKLDYRFVGDFLKVLPPDAKFKLDVASGTQPALMTTDDGYAYVVMPMALDG